jgi:hypothetical protein
LLSSILSLSLFPSFSSIPIRQSVHILSFITVTGIFFLG